jgi:hypothetical protein
VTPRARIVESSHHGDWRARARLGARARVRRAARAVDAMRDDRSRVVDVSRAR